MSYVPLILISSTFSDYDVHTHYQKLVIVGWELEDEGDIKLTEYVLRSRSLKKSLESLVLCGHWSMGRQVSRNMNT